MKLYVLGIEASTSVASVAIVRGDSLLAERVINNQRTHSVNLMPIIDSVFKDARIRPKQLQGIAVTKGPGSFTGIRIGLAMAKTLAQVWDLPLIGIGTLEALAYTSSGLKGFVCPVIIARKNEVYAALYEIKENLECLIDPFAIDPYALARKLGDIGRPVTFTGDGTFIYKEVFYNFLGERAVFLPGELSLPRGAAVAGLGWRKLRAGERVDPLLLTPLYVKMSEAEVKWLQKTRVKK